MYFGISMEVDAKASERFELVQKASDELAEYLVDKNYGADIERVYIGFVCVKLTPGYENWFKTRKPKHVLNRTLKKLDGSVEIIHNSYSYDIKIRDEDYSKFICGTENDALCLLKHLIIESLSNFDKLPKRIKDFDASAFKEDIVAQLNRMEVN